MELNHTSQDLLQKKKLIENYIQFFATPNQKIEILNNLLDSQIISEGERACALYEITSNDKDLGTMLVSEWYKMKNDRITSIFSVYDATTVNSAFSRI